MPQVDTVGIGEGAYSICSTGRAAGSGLSRLSKRLFVLLANIINRCLQKDPGNRYASAREIVRELRAGLQG